MSTVVEDSWVVIVQTPEKKYGFENLLENDDLKYL